MKKELTTFLRILTTIPVLAFVALAQFPVNAQSIVDLGYPHPAEEFFRQGRQQLELEIQRLQTPRPATLLLTIDPRLEQQMRTEVQRIEQGNLPTQPPQPQAPTSPKPQAQPKL